jgi:hypothetical protein
MRPPRKHGIYLLHFEPRYQHAGHYLGFSDNIQERVGLHRDGKSGVRMLKAASQAGCVMFLVRTWPGGRKDERRMKGLRNAKRVGSLARICPVCQALKKAGKDEAEANHGTAHEHGNGMP